MRKCYPIVSTQENWLHDAITNIIMLVHEKLDAGETIENSHDVWLNIVENSVAEEKIDAIKSLTGIRDRLFKYKDEVCKLTQKRRQTILKAMASQNEIENLLNGTEQIKLINKSYPKVHTAAKELFVFCFEKLTDLSIRENQYKIIFDSLPDKICSFCGIERIMNPEETAQDQDHYLAKSIYPFAATNMRNLTPMCRCCNRDYKKGTNIIIGSNNTRRKAFNPYNCAPPDISLYSSVLILDSSPIRFQWEIDFLSSTEESETWDNVFSIRTRYKRDVLDQYFDKWLSGFSQKCAKERRRGKIHANSTSDQVREHLQFYQEDKADNPSTGLAGFLEPLVFSLLLKLYDEDNERIVKLIRDAVLGVSLDDVA